MGIYEDAYPAFVINASLTTTINNILAAGFHVDQVVDSCAGKLTILTHENLKFITSPNMNAMSPENAVLIPIPNVFRFCEAHTTSIHIGCDLMPIVQEYKSFFRAYYSMLCTIDFSINIKLYDLSLYVEERPVRYIKEY